ncbi:MAG: response regulator transcription factor [Dehalococcoidia bacterium]|nr:MAG: response regulator transcription factor [Dehalococcoidia bacterium]
MKALIIEDDPEIVESVSLAFQMGWPEATLITTHLGKKGLEIMEVENPDIIILDLGLPDIGGFEVLKQTRLFSSVPIIILTAKTDEVDIVKGLEWGADDFLVKPCGQLELLARIKARVREKNNHNNDAPISYGPLYFNPLTRQLMKDTSEIKLTAIEAHIINRLMINSGRVATYSKLAECVWGDDYPGSVDSLRVHIRRLREKIEEEPSQPKIIITKSGIGYSLAKFN